MGSLIEMQKVLRQKEERIAELEDLLKFRDEELAEMRTKLDKFMSVLPTSPSLVNICRQPRLKRALGISAEPQVQKSVQELSEQVFKKYPKSKR
nr:cGMP-dependent protein kinase, isozyme 2 forms cD4/T1/T3A/T3B-like [Lytechinus pictus]